MSADAPKSDRSRSVAILLVLAVFILGVALGSIGTYLEGYRVFGAPRRPVPDRSPAGMQRGRQAQVERMTRDLTLTADQQKQLDSILSQAQAQYGSIHEKWSVQMDQERKQMRDQIRAILSPEQTAKFEEILHKMDEERKKRMGN
jgi:flagellar basal body-associated protein FliL